VRIAAGVACLVIAACAGEPREVAHDLARELAIAEVLQETPVIDVGTEPARRWLAEGWYPDEGGGGGPDFAWSEGDDSVIELQLLAPRTIAAELRCRPLAITEADRSQVHVILNGEALTSLELRSGFAAYPLTLPSPRLHRGRNRLQFRFPAARSPRELGLGDDWRRLAMAVDWLRLAPGDPPPAPSASADGTVLSIPHGTIVAYALRSVDGMRLELDGVRERGGSGARLRCTVVGEDGWAVPVAEVAPGDVMVGVDLPRSADRWLRLELEAVGPAPNGGSVGTLEVVRPRLTTPAATVPAGRTVRQVGRQGAVPAPNIVVYLVDALRADRVGVYGQERPLTPNLDAFAAAATVYDRAWAQSSWTRPAVASLFTGLRPEVHGVTGRLDRLDDTVETLAERLASAGYATSAVVANPNVSATFGLNRGFDHFVLMPADCRRSSEVHREVERWLDGRDPSRPFLLYVHTVDPHLPYDPPARFRERFAPAVERRDLGATEVVGTLLARDLVDEGGWADDLMALYDAEVASNDAAFGALLDELQSRGLGESTAVVFLSDHGEEFYDHGGWIHGRTLYREVLQVPLVIRFPNQRDGRRVPEPVSHVDLMPTLLELAGVDPGDGLHGCSLAGAIDPHRSVGGHLDLDGWGGWSAVDAAHHAIRHQRLGYAGPAELYDLDGDPAELHDVAPKLGVTAGALIDESRREIVEEVGRHQSGPTEVDDDLRQRLEALGYL
jgi:arylsulfatase A-like enzyme